MNRYGRAFAATIIAAACAAHLPTQSDAQILTIGVRAGPESIDPHFTATGTHAEALKHVFDTLVWSGDASSFVRRRPAGDLRGGPAGELGGCGAAHARRPEGGQAVAGERVGGSVDAAGR